jgi:DNA-binding winged helix-turn-helix (wHTH) protein
VLQPIVLLAGVGPLVEVEIAILLHIFGEYTLDTQRYELCRAGHVNRLQPKVFQVLVYLLAHADRVVAR